MILREIEVLKADGIQRGDAQSIVQRTMRYVSSVVFEWKACKVNAKSLMGIMSMGLKKGNKFMVIINGEDQDEAMEDIVRLFEEQIK